MAVYNYSIASDTATGALNATLLLDEVRDVLSSAEFINIEGDLLSISFPVTLSGSQQLALTGVVNAHTGEEIVEVADDTVTVLQTTPGANQDISAGFDLGEVAIDESTGAAYVLTDNTQGAAVWQRITTPPHNTLTGLSANDHPQYQLTSEKAVAGGYASLDGQGKIPVGQIPATALPSVSVVANAAARLALTVQEGDEAIQTDDGSQWIWDGSTWIQRPTGNVGDVVAPGSATDNALARYDGVSGQLLQDSLVTVDDTGNLSLPGTVDGRDVSADGSTLDSHIANLNNPHQTSIGNLGQGSLAQLNSKVTDATLDDSSASRPPLGHNSSHSAGGSDPVTAQNLSSGAAVADQILVTDGTGGWNLEDKPESSSTAFTAYFDGYSTSGTTSNNTNWVDLPINVERKKTSQFTHLANAADVSVSVTGTYIVFARVTTDVTAGSRQQSELRVLLNGSTIAGSIGRMYNRQGTQGESTATVPLTLDLTAGDTLRIQWRKLSGNGTIRSLSQGSGITIFTTTGEAGPQGPAGPPGVSGVEVQDDGAVVEPAAQGINFGSGLNTSTSGGVVTVNANLAPVFGEGFASDENLTEVTTTSTTFQDHTILNINLANAGTYYATWGARWDVNVGPTDIQSSMPIEFVIDGTVYGLNQWTEQGFFVETSNFKVLPLTAGAHTLVVRFRSGNGASTSMHQSRIAIWRVA